jgi:hypothetical protein
MNALNWNSRQLTQGWQRGDDVFLLWTGDDRGRLRQAASGDRHSAARRQLVQNLHAYVGPQGGGRLSRGRDAGFPVRDSRRQRQSGTGHGRRRGESRLAKPDREFRRVRGDGCKQQLKSVTLNGLKV